MIILNTSQPAPNSKLFSPFLITIYEDSGSDIATFILVDFLAAETEHPRRHDPFESPTTSVYAIDLASYSLS